MAPESNFTMALFKFVGILSLIYQASAYPNGAPGSTCFTQYPKHNGIGTQTSPSPYIFTMTPDKYSPGQEIAIEVEDGTGATIIGIQIAARRLNGNDDEIVGRFVDYPTDKLKTFNCFGGYQNILTHSNRDKVNKLSFKWKAPNYNVGDVVFRSTVVRSYDIFWYDVMTNLSVDSTAPLTAPTYPMIPLTERTTSIDFDACGDTKGCFYYPRHCTGSNCIAVATYLYRPATKDFLFELHSSKDDNYVALGFSHDEIMADDATFICTGRTAKMSVQEGWNPGYYNERNMNLFSSSHEIRYADGKLQCSFVVPETFNVYRMKGDPNAFTYNNIKIDLNKDWYLFLAWGPTMLDSDVITHHHDLPPISSSKVDLKEKIITFSSVFNIMVRAHASLMIVAWILLTGLVTVVSRHYRDWLPRTRFLGTKVWFQIHRELAILVFILTVIGIILIFAHYGTGIRKYATPHAEVGLAVVACVSLQMIAGLLRPGQDNKLRPVFNWGHRFLGHATHILAAATMFLAFKISYITSDMQEFGFIVLSVWVVVQVVWHIIFEIITWRTSKSAKSESYALEGNGDVKPANQETTTKSSSQYSLLFIIYLVCLISLCVATLLAVLLF